MFPFPTQNENLPFRPAQFDTIADALDYAAQGRTGICIYNIKGEVAEGISYSDLRAMAVYYAGKLLALGLRRGDRVAVIAETCLDFFAIFYGCQYAGLIPCSVPFTIYMGGKNSYALRIHNLVKTAGASLLCVPDELAEIAAEAAADLPLQVATWTDLKQISGNGIMDPLRDGDLAYIQFSSGSTSDPKGIAVTQKSLTSNIDGILNQCIRATPQDRAFCWLPLYHDMGMVGFALAPLYAQASVDFMSAATFARNPTLWVDLMSRNRSTVTYAPTFGFELVAKRLKPSETPHDLSALRLVGIGGDEIKVKAMSQFADALASAGFDPAAFTPSYGMAESTLMVSFSHGLRTDRVSSNGLEHRSYAEPSAASDEDGREFVICGHALRDHAFKVVDDQGLLLADRELGHIEISGPSLTAGYFSDEGFSPITLSPDGYYATGDLGYRLGDELVITGRHKEMILLNGRNIWPQDLEATVDGLDEVPAKRVIAFALETEAATQITILAEISGSAPDQLETWRKKIIAALFSASGVTVQVYFVALRSLPVTSSGKLARALAKQHFMRSEYEVF